MKGGATGTNPHAVGTSDRSNTTQNQSKTEGQGCDMRGRASGMLPRPWNSPRFRVGSSLGRADPLSRRIHQRTLGLTGYQNNPQEFLGSLPLEQFAWITT